MTLELRVATGARAGATERFSRPVVTKVSPSRAFTVAEEYHQNYATLHPNDLYIRINDAPKVENLKKSLGQLYKAELSSWK